MIPAIIPQSRPVQLVWMIYPVVGVPEVASSTESAEGCPGGKRPRIFGIINQALYKDAAGFVMYFPVCGGSFVECIGSITCLCVVKILDVKFIVVGTHVMERFFPVGAIVAVAVS